MAERKRDYPTLVEVMAIHRFLATRFGGSTELRDAGAIESALFRPQTGHYADVLEEAAALWESLTLLPCFVDGQRRTGFAVTDAFLRMNGFKIDTDPSQAHAFIERLLERGEFRMSALDGWLRTHTAPTS